jgi:hypothetical protein
MYAKTVVIVIPTFKKFGLLPNHKSSRQQS